MKIIRLLTFISYFMPFIFLTYGCDGIDTIPFYNRVEAEKWEKDHPRKPVESAAKTDSTMVIESADTSAVSDGIGYDTIKKETSAGQKIDRLEKSTPIEIDYGTEIISFLISPADESLSGTGIMMLYENLTGRIFIAISFLGSLVVLVLDFLRKQRLKTGMIIQGIGVSCLISFVTISLFFVKADLLWGFWLCFVLSVISFCWQIARVKKM